MLLRIGSRCAIAVRNRAACVSRNTARRQACREIGLRRLQPQSRVGRMQASSHQQWSTFGPTLLSGAPRAAYCSAAAASPAARHLQVAEQCMSMHDYEGVINACSTAIHFDSASATAFGLRASAHEALKDYEKAMKDYEIVIALVPQHLPSHVGLARSLCAVGKYERAMKICDDVLYMDPKMTIGILTKAEALSHLERTEECIHFLRDGLQKVPDAAVLHLFLARVLLQQSSGGEQGASGEYYNEGHGHAKTAVEIDPNDPSARLLCGIYEYIAKRFDLAIDQFRAGIDLCNEVTASNEVQYELITKLANAYFVSKRFNDAVEWATRAIDVNPGDSTAYATRGQCFAEQGNYGSAVVDLTAYIDLLASYALLMRFWSRRRSKRMIHVVPFALLFILRFVFTEQVTIFAVFHRLYFNALNVPEARQQLAAMMYLRVSCYHALFRTCVLEALDGTPEEIEAQLKAAQGDKKLRGAEEQMSLDMDELMYKVLEKSEQSTGLGRDAGRFFSLGVSDLLKVVELDPSYEQKATMQIAELISKARFYVGMY